MRLTDEDLLQEKISLAEEESNDLDRIESEKRQFDALQDWSKKPRYQMPETILERAKRWLSSLFEEKDWCSKHEMYHERKGRYLPTDSKDVW